MALMAVARFMPSPVRSKLQIGKNLLSKSAKIVVFIPKISKTVSHDLRLRHPKKSCVLLEQFVLFARHGDCHPDDVVVVHTSACNLVFQLCQAFWRLSHGVNQTQSVYR